MKKIKENLTKEVKDIVVVKKQELVLEGDPEAQMQYAQKAATALMIRVNNKPKKVIIGGKQYLEYGDWQTLARFFGATAGVEWTKPIAGSKGELLGYEARAIVYQHGEIIASAEASCMFAERNWKGKDEFALKSMSQTRAAAKALRNGFGWVAELAGYSSTPAEEMDGVSKGEEVYDTSPASEKVISTGDDVVSTPQEEVDPVCVECGTDITLAEYNWSKQRQGKPLCRDHQKSHAKTTIS